MVRDPYQKVCAFFCGMNGHEQKLLGRKRQGFGQLFKLFGFGTNNLGS